MHFLRINIEISNKKKIIMFVKNQQATERKVFNRQAKLNVKFT